MSRVELQQVSFTYPGASEAVIDDVSLVIGDAEAHAFLGASGTGKTTLLNLLSGILAPTSGRILIDGHDVTQASGYQRRVSQVFQFPVLYESLTVAQNLAFPLAGRGRLDSQAQARVGEIVAELGLQDVLNTRPRQLSLYQKQLLAVGKALVRRDTSLVLLDEPLTAVQPSQKWALRQMLRRAQTDLGVTMVYVTHDQTEALTFADRVSVLGTSGILQSDTPAQIYASPATEYVAHFVGSPGMNLLTAQQLATLPQLAGTDIDTLGFRPEWARLQATAGHLRGTAHAFVPLSTTAGEHRGLVEVQLTSGQRVQVYGGAGDAQPGQPCEISLDRYVTFKAGNLVACHEF